MEESKRGPRVIILVGLVIIATMVIVGAVLFTSGRFGTLSDSPSDEDAAATLEPEILEILVAANNLVRGMQITEGYVVLQRWPIDDLPMAYYTDPTQVVDHTLRVDIPQGMPLMPSMLTMEPLTAEAEDGSDAALTIPPGKRAYAIPMDLIGAVAWTIEPGDHVDIMFSWLISELDEEFQTELPNQYVCIGEQVSCQGIYGRTEILPTGQVILEYPSGTGQSRYVAQMTIQNAIVMGVGQYEARDTTVEDGARPADDPSSEGGSSAPEEQPLPEEGVPSAPAPAAQAVILIVDPQDALVLKSLIEIQADVDLLLRAAGDNDIVVTDPVSLEYIMSRYSIELPAKLPYMVGPSTPNPLEAKVESAAVESGNRPAE